jgi:hypothetical protein
LNEYNIRKNQMNSKLAPINAVAVAAILYTADDLITMNI